MTIPMTRAEMIEELRRQVGEATAARADTLSTDEQLRARIESGRAQRAAYAMAAARKTSDAA